MLRRSLGVLSSSTGKRAVSTMLRRPLAATTTSTATSPSSTAAVLSAAYGGRRWVSMGGGSSGSSSSPAEDSDAAQQSKSESVSAGKSSGAAHNIKKTSSSDASGSGSASAGTPLGFSSNSTGVRGRDGSNGAGVDDAAEKMTQNNMEIMYNAWARNHDTCNGEELLSGSKQAYYSLGVVLQSMVAATKTIPPTEKNVVTRSKVVSDALRKEYLKEEAGMSRLASATSSLPSPQKEKEGGDAKGHSILPASLTSQSSISEALQHILPITSDLANLLSAVCQKQMDKAGNLFNFASGNDFILKSKLLYFYDGGKNLYVAQELKDNVETCKDVRIVSGELLEEEARTCSLATHPIGSSDPKATKKPEEAEGAVKDGDAAASEEREDKRSLIISGKVVPENALGFVVVCVDVVVPPGRYVNGFDWFYQRIVGHDSEYERIATAMLFAAANIRGFASCMDFLSRMIFGKSAEYHIGASYLPLMGINKDVSRCPPATQKALTFYLDTCKRWVLMDVTVVGYVSTTPLPETV